MKRREQKRFIPPPVEKQANIDRQRRSHARKLMSSLVFLTYWGSKTVFRWGHATNIVYFLFVQVLPYARILAFGARTIRFDSAVHVITIVLQRGCHIRDRVIREKGRLNVAEVLRSHRFVIIYSGK